LQGFYCKTAALTEYRPAAPDRVQTDTHAPAGYIIAAARMPPKGTNGKKNSCPKDGTKVDDEGLSQRWDKNG